MNEEVAGQLLKVKDVFNVNALAQGAAVKLSTIRRSSGSVLR